MNEIQIRLVQLLKELDELCAKKNIPYVLFGRTAKDAYKHNSFYGDYVTASILVQTKDFLRLRRAIAGKRSRKLESVLDCPGYPNGKTMRYVDEDTVFMYGHNAHLYRYHGIYVTIEPATALPQGAISGKINRLCNAMITAIGLTELPYEVEIGKKKRIALKIIRFVAALLGKGFLVRSIFALQNLFVRKGEKLVYLRKGKKDVPLPSGTFSKIKRTVFEGAEFCVPVDEEVYLQAVYGTYVDSEEKMEPVSLPHLLVASTEVSYRTLELSLLQDDLRIQTQKMMDERNALNSVISSFKKKIEKYWDVLFLTRERYRLYGLYKPIEGILQQRFEEGDYDWVNLVMQEYLDSVVTYAKKGWPIQVSLILDAIALKILGQQNASVAASFGQLVASNRLKPITLEIDEEMEQAAIENMKAVLEGATVSA